MDDHLVGDVVRLVDTASYGWAGLRRWRLDRGSSAASAGEVRQSPGSGGYRLRRIFAGSARLALLPAVYDVSDTSGRPWLRVELSAARSGSTAAASVSLDGEAPAGLVPAVRRSPLGAGLTITGPDGDPLLLVPDERGLSWSALDPAGLPVARAEHVPSRAGWVDRGLHAGQRDLRAGSGAGRTSFEELMLSGDVLSFERGATPLQRALVLGLAVCRAHPRS